VQRCLGAHAPVRHAMNRVRAWRSRRRTAGGQRVVSEGKQTEQTKQPRPVDLS
jgi:hypothetical protein